VLGFCSGAVAGLVMITPSCGYVDPTGAVIIGVAAGVVPFFACTKLKSWFHYDDALDTFGVHAVGGTLGAFLTGVFATASVNPNLAKLAGHALWLQQLKAIVITIFLATVCSAIIGAIVRAVRNTASRTFESFREWREERRREKQRRDVIAKHVKKGTPLPAFATASAGTPEINTPGANRSPKGSRAPSDDGARGVNRAERDERQEDEDDDENRPWRPASAGLQSRATDIRLKADAIKADATKPKVAMPPLPLPDPEPIAKAPAERRKGDYTLPPLALLDAPKTQRKFDERELMERARLLEEKCREFAVEGSVVQIHPGPVVTTFEFKPNAGVKYSKITNLEDDLCLAMQAESVLIDRIPGKSTVGIQIPNQDREQISLRELLESEVYRRSTSKISLALGKTIHGEPFVADLATMPHLLIAGSTGAGKSVGINGMLTSILYRATPDDVRLIMVDPKRLELGMYDDIPHLLTPVVVDPKQAANALRWAVREMEERYRLLAAEGVRNIEQFNRNMQQAIAEKREPRPDHELKPLPFIVVVIDELGDLMMVAGNEVEQSIARLAQMARAVGIHLILATQRPSVDVITGLIKANLPTRIAFRVASKVDSRTILDGNGAEQLLGRGDMLLLPPASSRFIRLHGPYISEQESARLASYLRKQGKPTYDESITQDEKAATEGAPEFEKDDLYDEAARIVVQGGQASISYLQRRLRIGFSRAARLVDMMEMEGLVSPAAGGKPREVLVDKHYFDEVDAQLR